MEDLSLMKKQAKYLDEKIRSLELLLEYPASLIYPKLENISLAEKVIKQISKENEELLKNISEEENVCRKNIEEMKTFLQNVRAESEHIAKETQDMRRQLESYGYVPMVMQDEMQNDTFIVAQSELPKKKMDLTS